MSEVEASGYPFCDPSTVAPLRTDRGKTYPNLSDHMPSRLVTQAEAKARGWVFFFANEPCRFGHIAPRYVCNERLCVDCEREKRGKPPIGKVATDLPKQKQPKRITTHSKTGRPIKPPVPSDLTAEERQFLEAYATFKDFDRAADEVKLVISRPQIEAQLSCSRKFAAAVNALEERLSIKRVAVVSTVFEWSDEKRSQLITAFVDTGDIASARDAIGVTPSEYLREIDRNETFAAEVKRAEPLANRMLVERATQLALKGNDKLLSKLLAAEMPEKYRESVKVDVNQNTVVRMEDGALDARLAKLLGKGRVIDAQFVAVDGGREARAIAAPRREATPRVAEQTSEYVPGAGDDPLLA